MAEPVLSTDEKIFIDYSESARYYWRWSFKEDFT
jgi:hypothetical protein